MKQRTIKFKAKRLYDGVWVQGDLLHKDNKTYIYNPRINDKGFYVENEEVDPPTVCQFTGLTDMKGQEIWEHDILENSVRTNEVVFENGSFMIIDDYGDEIVESHLNTLSVEGFVYFYRVVGNIFDREDEKQYSTT